MVDLKKPKWTFEINWPLEFAEIIFAAFLCPNPLTTLWFDEILRKPTERNDEN